MAAASHHFQASVTLPFSPTAGQFKLPAPGQWVTLHAETIWNGDGTAPWGLTDVGLYRPMPAIDAPQPLSPVKTVRLDMRLSFSRTVTGVSGVTGALTQHPGGVSGGVVFVKKTPEPGRVAMSFDALVQATSKPIRLRCLSER
ncbi:uncharacterized protein FTOL_09552 [Fusarium torulosum]|uniref:Uncharacterized protein n=1 Tax=Fusarium torulosum TaxID=33205 RepID=A0AAE8SLG9_9HYPO|nr:uncharacterized protein FTOL_09552 [Fusarium torulosum]